MEFLPRIALVLCLGSLAFAAPAVHAAQAAAPAAAAGASGAAKPAAKAATSPKAVGKTKSRQPVKKARASAKAAAAPATPERLDLSLPKSVNMDYKPDLDNADLPVKPPPLLPAMFPDTPTTNDNGFQLNGRLISNEMQLQLRNESRRDLEGAAIEFQFRQ